MSEYLNYIPLPHLNDIKKRKVVPLIGAGFSKNAEGLKEGEYMPLWDDLGFKFADILKVPYKSNPVEVISEFVTKNSKIQLVEYLAEFLHHQVAKPGDAHKYLVRLPFVNLFYI